MHLAVGGSSRGAERWVCRSSQAPTGADSAPWELSPSVLFAPAQHCDNPRSAVSPLIVHGKHRHLPASQPGICAGLGLSQEEQHLSLGWFGFPLQT